MIKFHTHISQRLHLPICSQSMQHVSKKIISLYIYYFHLNEKKEQICTTFRQQHDICIYIFLNETGLRDPRFRLWELQHPQVNLQLLVVLGNLRWPVVLSSTK
jgi:hypothetical protein